MRAARFGIGLVVVALGGGAHAAEPHIVFDGGKARDYLGSAVAGVGDVNGDGFDDILIGAVTSDPGGREDAGSAFLVSGKDGTQLHRFEGEFAGDNFGNSVDAAGDVDDDGVPDVIIGAEKADLNGLPDFGKVYVFSGDDYSLLHRFDGDQPGSLFGDSVGGAGDVNQDGHDDLIVGATFYDVDGRRDAGRAWVYSGADGSQLHVFDGEFVIDGVGWDVDGAGDLDGDEHDDVLVSAPHTDPFGRRNAGSVWAYSGRTGALIWRHDGTNALDYFGLSCAGVGDMNGDGVPDAVAGAPTSDPGGREIAGSFYMLSGADGSILRVFHGDAPFLYLGTRVGGAGDVDGDGYMDAIVGAPHTDPEGMDQAGTAYVLSGRTGYVILRVDGLARGNVAGWGVDGAGDVNDDGYSDIVVGMPNYYAGNGTLRRAGRAVVVLGECMDEDGDGWGAGGAPLCAQPDDCNDRDAAVNPGAAEIPRNGIDDDCDPLTPDVPTGCRAAISANAGAASTELAPLVASLAALALSRRRRRA